MSVCTDEGLAGRTVVVLHTAAVHAVRQANARPAETETQRNILSPTKHILVQQKQVVRSPV